MANAEAKSYKQGSEPCRPRRSLSPTGSYPHLGRVLVRTPMGWPSSEELQGPLDVRWPLTGPVAILYISRDTFSDSIAKIVRACFPGVSHKYRAICCKMH